jgi:hypothetical protein
MGFLSQNYMLSHFFTPFLLLDPMLGFSGCFVPIVLDIGLTTFLAYFMGYYLIVSIIGFIFYF